MNPDSAGNINPRADTASVRTIAPLLMVLVTSNCHNIKSNQIMNENITYQRLK